MRWNDEDTFAQVQRDAAIAVVQRVHVDNGFMSKARLHMGSAVDNTIIDFKRFGPLAPNHRARQQKVEPATPGRTLISSAPRNCNNSTASKKAMTMTFFGL
jgi:hypothetical protein